MSRLDIASLSLLRSPAKQNDQHVTFLAEIDSISGPEIDLILVDPFSHRLDVGSMALFEAIERRSHLRRRGRIEPREPSSEGRDLPVEILDDPWERSH